MADKKEEVKEEVKDERGVEWKNVAEEFKRKFQELDDKYKNLEASLESSNESQTFEPSPDKVKELVQKELESLVASPKEYISSVIGEIEYLKESKKAVEWLREDKKLSNSDQLEISRIVRDYELMEQAPMKRAKSALRILEDKKKIGDIEKIKEDAMKEGEKRSRELSENVVEGVGRVAPTPSISYEKLKDRLAKSNDYEEQAYLVQEIDKVKRSQRR